MSRGDLEQHFEWMNQKKLAASSNDEATFRVSREEILKRFEAISESEDIPPIPKTKAVRPKEMLELVEIEEIEELDPISNEAILEGSVIADDDNDHRASDPRVHDEYGRMLNRFVAGGRYHLKELIGKGGMGAVFRATQTAMDRPVALKLIVPQNVVSAKRFEREAKFISQLSHPNTVTVFDYGVLEEGVVFLAMEFLEGRSLAHLIRHEGNLPPKRAVQIATQICRSLSEAHKRGIIHRDIKPDNIFLTRVDGNDDFVKVLDFGVAKAFSDEFDVNLTEDGRAVGTPRYMSPEQILGKPIDNRSDVYSLGCILYEMLSGSPPFANPSRTAVMLAHVQDSVPRFERSLTKPNLDRIPPQLEQVVRMALAKEPSERPGDVDQFRTLLERIESTLPNVNREWIPEVEEPHSSDFLDIENLTEDGPTDRLYATPIPEIDQPSPAQELVHPAYAAAPFDYPPAPIPPHHRTQGPTPEPEEVTTLPLSRSSENVNLTESNTNPLESNEELIAEPVRRRPWLLLAILAIATLIVIGLLLI